MDLCGLWGDCHSPDTFQQAISYYLGKMHIFRDIPIFDIELIGLEAGLLIPPEKIKSREQATRKLWFTALTKRMRSRYLAHSMKIRFFLESCAEGAKNITLNEKIAYPSKVICINDVGTREIYECTVYSFNIFALRLITRYFKTKIMSAMQNVINHISLVIMVIASAVLLTSHTSLLIRLICIGLLCFGTFIYKMDYLKAELSKRKSRGLIHE